LDTEVNLGLKHGVNRLVDYDPQWPTAFAEEKANLKKALGPIAISIEHYGSTSVPGMRAKPIIDILIGVPQLEDWSKCRPALEALGYDYAENAGVPGHFIFGRGRDKTERTHLVHVVEYEGGAWRRCLTFRDSLRQDADLRGDYLREKERAVTAAPEIRGKYNEIKEGFFERVVWEVENRTPQ
jgi:GrpB-like predicted nucleotidyltransferase (UPF0157 family)